MNEVVRVPDIAVCHDGTLHSLCGQKVVKSSSLETFAEGSGVVKEGVLYVLEDDWIVKMTTTGAEVVLGMKCDEDVTLDWGDGFAELVGRNGQNTTYRHTYTESVASHRIVLRGKDTALRQLFCDNNNLTSLDVSKNIALRVLLCKCNNLTSLDVSKNTELIELQCESNNLVTLDVSKNIALMYLEFHNNNLTSLDVSKNTELVALKCRYNNLTMLDVSKNTRLVELWCEGNNLVTLDVSKNIRLALLTCMYTNLTVLDVSKNTELAGLWCEGNNFTALDLSKNVLLMVLTCGVPLVSDLNEFMTMVNTLVDRTGINAGGLIVIGDVDVEPIRGICYTKNWNITVS